MKKSILLAIVFCFATAVSLSAQIRFGVKAGGNLSTLYVSGDRSGINAEQYKFRFSYHFGGMMEYKFSDIFSIQPELVYLNHGANLKKDNSFSMKDGHITLNSLQLPVNFKATFPLGNNHIFVYGGPYASYHIYGKARGKIEGKSQDVELYSNGASGIRRWDYGVGIGVGMEIDKLVITLGNQIGLADINRANDSKMKTGGLTLSAGYFF